MKLNKITIHLHLEIKFEKRSDVSAIMKSLIPDNSNYPKGLVLKMVLRHGNILVIEIFCEGGVYTLINTIDEILDHIAIAEKVISYA
jgi:hypothetical protein